MRALVVSIWIFINLIFFGMCGYMYLLWSQYWMYIQNDSTTPVYTYDQQIYYYNRGYPPSYFNYSIKINTTDRYRRSKKVTKGNPITVIKNSRPRFPSFQESDFKMDNVKLKCSDNDTNEECDAKTLEYKINVLKELKRVTLEESSVLRSKNPYNVSYSGTREESIKDARELLCSFKSVKIKTLTNLDYPFSKNAFKYVFPKKKLLENKFFKNCAVVSSAGSLKGSQLGEYIDSHEMVLRFNHAPTENFEDDVGQKTTLRILNSQVVSKPQFQFLESNLYRNITILIWDPSRYQSTLEEWFLNPDFDFFTNYYEHRKKYRKTKSYILNPQSLWDLWIFLQNHSPIPMRRNPPSSGFLGLAVLLPYCEYIDLFEYIPSVRVTKKCHYYDSDDNPSCTFGAWHPLAAEKLFAYSLNTGNDHVVFQKGYIRIPGFKTC
ncbi:hypothetical protein FQA39_LY09691 [Lamprigera yunnana]|nr:hypothetical protein FQA39_LY09691 [Lamprigera yunnana]